MAQILETDPFMMWRKKINETLGTQGDVENINLSPENRVDIPTAFNTIIGYIGLLADLTTTNKTTLVSAINEVKGITATLINLTSGIGSLTTLSTTEKTTLVAAINEIYNALLLISVDTMSIGNLTALTTTIKDTLVNAINEINNRFLTASMVVGEKLGNKITVSIQLKNSVGDTISSKRKVSLYLSDDAVGNTLSINYPDGGITTTNGLILSGSNKMIDVVSTDTGTITLELTHSSPKNYYLVLVLPITGALITSSLITF